MNMFSKPVISLLSLLALTVASSSVHAVYVDLSGISINGGVGNALTMTITEDENLPNVDMIIEYSFNIETHGDSWGSEFSISLTDEWYGHTVSVSGDDCGWVGGGSFSCIGAWQHPGYATIGEDWTLVILDSYNDIDWITDYLDFTFTDNSFIRWGDDLTAATATAVPEPSVVALLSLGVFGLGLSRRKLNK